MPRIARKVFTEAYGKQKTDKTICFVKGKAVSVVRSKKIKNEASLSHKLYDLHYYLAKSTTPTSQKNIKTIASRIYTKEHKHLGLIRRFIFSINNLFQGRGFHSEIYFYNQIRNFAIVKASENPSTKAKQPEKSESKSGSEKPAKKEKSEAMKDKSKASPVDEPIVDAKIAGTRRKGPVRKRRQPKPLRDFSDLKAQFEKIKQYNDVIASLNAKIIGMDQGELDNWKYGVADPTGYIKFPKDCQHLKGIIAGLNRKEIDDWAKQGILPAHIRHEVKEKDSEFEQLIGVIADDLNTLEIKAWANERAFPFNFNQIPYSKQMPIVIVAAPQGGGGRAKTYTPETDYRIPNMMKLIFHKLSDEQLKAMMMGYFTKDRSRDTTSNWAFINMLIGINDTDKQLELTKMLLKCTIWNSELLKVGNCCIGKKGDVDYEAIKSFIQNYVEISFEFDNAGQRLDRLWDSSSAFMLAIIDQKFFNTLSREQRAAFIAWHKEKAETDHSVNMFKIKT